MFKNCFIWLSSCRERKTKWDLGNLVKRGIYWRRLERRTPAPLKLLLLEQRLIQPKRSLPYSAPKSPVFSTAGTNSGPHLIYNPLANVPALYQNRHPRSVSALAVSGPGAGGAPRPSPPARPAAATPPEPPRERRRQPPRAHRRPALPHVLQRCCLERRAEVQRSRA